MRIRLRRRDDEGLTIRSATMLCEERGYPCAVVKRADCIHFEVRTEAGVRSLLTGTVTTYMQGESRVDRQGLVNIFREFGPPVGYDTPVKRG